MQSLPRLLMRLLWLLEFLQSLLGCVLQLLCLCCYFFKCACILDERHLLAAVLQRVQAQLQQHSISTGPACWMNCELPSCK